MSTIEIFLPRCRAPHIIAAPAVPKPASQQRFMDKPQNMRPGTVNQTESRKGASPPLPQDVPR